MSDNETYLLIKYTRSVLRRVAKRLSYIEDARCPKVNVHKSSCFRGLPIQMEPISCSETSVMNHQSTPRKIPKKPGVNYTTTEAEFFVVECVHSVQSSTVIFFKPATTFLFSNIPIYIFSNDDKRILYFENGYYRRLPKLYLRPNH